MGSRVLGPLLGLSVMGALMICTLFLLKPSPSPPFHRWPLEVGTHEHSATWDQLLDSHLKDRRGDRVVLCKWTPENNQGLCNRMLHSASCLLFAMLTRRTLLLHWPGNEFKWDGDMNEFVGIDPFDAIFEPSPYMVQSIESQPNHVVPSIKPKTNHVVLSIESSQQNCRYMDTEDLEVIRWLRREDPRQLHADAWCIEIRDSWRFWGGMLAHNPHVSYGPPSEAFSAVAARALVPLPSNASWTNGTAEGCEWLVQYRDRARGNGRLNPLLPAFLECGRLHGMRAPKGVWFLSDQDHPEARALRSAPLAYCRHEPGCDRDTVHLMRYLGSCKRVLLSDYSTFGQCLAGLSTVKQQWVVHATLDGGSSCSRKHNLEPSWRLSDFAHSLRASPTLAGV